MKWMEQDGARGKHHGLQNRAGRPAEVTYVTHRQKRERGTQYVDARRVATVTT
jgi:hypothetical protein